MAAEEKLEEKWVVGAHKIVELSGEILRKFFRSSELRVEMKEDGSPVCNADREAEEAMRSEIKKLFPETSIFGEERGWSSVGGSRYTWVIDPIDGTKSFVAGKPTFGTLLALLRDGKPVLGIIDQPITKERWFGAEGYPSTLNGARIQTDSSTTEIKDAILFCTSVEMFHTETERKAFQRVKESSRFCVYGSDCYGYGLLASGYGGLIMESDLEPYDFCAAVPIIQGAGGTVTDWEGNPLTLDSVGEVMAAANTALAFAAYQRLVPPNL